MTDAPASFTVVSFHAHPDDEALLTSGTLARAVAEGHRVVLVVATAGEAGLVDAALVHDLGARRRRELEASAAAIGAARVELLGYADSGSTPRPPAHAATPGHVFADLDPEVVAADLATILVEERADLLTVYDPAGGYGHPDHVQVHRAGLRAAELAGTRVVLEATLDRRHFSIAIRALRLLSAVVAVPRLPDPTHAYTATEELTHRVDVRRHLDAKRGSLRAHASQSRGGGPRTLGLLLRLPAPVARLLLGHEYFREVGRAPGHRLLDDVFVSLRSVG